LTHLLEVTAFTSG